MNRVLSAFKITFLSGLAGWGAGILCWIILAGYNSIMHPEAQGVINLGSGAGWILVCTVEMLFLLVPVWILVFLPLTLLVPDHSFLWKTRILTIAGFFAGPIIIGVFATLNLYEARLHSDMRIYDKTAYMVSIFAPFGIPAAIIGAVTCLTAGMLHRRTPT